MTALLAITGDQGVWWVSLGVGLVIAIVVWALLEALRRTVVAVDEAVADVWTMGKRLAANTQTTHLLQTTHERGADLLTELEQHHPSDQGRQR